MFNFWVVYGWFKFFNLNLDISYWFRLGHKGPGKYSEGDFINEWFSGGQKIYLEDGTPLSKWWRDLTPMYLQAMESFGHPQPGSLGDFLRMVINHVSKSWPQDAGSSPPGNGKKTFLGDLGISTETFISHEQSHIGSRVHSLKLAVRT